jgi:tetratricopeptide (TPR) repeat protein
MPSAKILLSTLLAALTSLTALHGQATPKAAGGAQGGEVAVLARQAQASLTKGAYASAIRDYERLVKVSPASAEFHLGLGSAYYSAGQPRDAVEPLRQALRLKPRSAEAGALLGVSLAETNRCPEALPHLEQAAPRLTDPHLRRSVGSDGVKCAMAANRQSQALDFLERLRRQFPSDPEVLYMSVHVFSDLSTRASQALLTLAPGSYQVHLLNAESLEMQGKWDDAAAEYRKVLSMQPNLPGINYRLGRLILSKPKTATTLDDAKREFEEEIEIDPGNAGAQYVLGELARQSQDWNSAIQHFSQAVKNDPDFADAMVELGRALVSADRAAEAVPPLERAVKLQPANPGAHYLLSTAYRRVGRDEDAKREMAAFQQAQAKARENLQDIRSAVTGQVTPAEKSEAEKK